MYYDCCLLYYVSKYHSFLNLPGMGAYKVTKLYFEQWVWLSIEYAHNYKTSAASDACSAAACVACVAYLYSLASTFSVWPRGPYFIPSDIVASLLHLDIMWYLSCQLLFSLTWV